MMLITGDMAVLVNGKYMHIMCTSTNPDNLKIKIQRLMSGPRPLVKTYFIRES